MRVIEKMGQGEILKMMIFAFGIFVTTPAAAGCHRYTHWHYPFPQHCGIIRRVVMSIPQTTPHPTPVSVIPDIPVPDYSKSIYPPEIIRALNKALAELHH